MCRDVRARGVAGAQGAYYVVTGVWPLVHLASFEAVTGPKTDDWLVRVVGLLVLVIGAVLVGAARGAPGRDAWRLGTWSAAAFLVADVVMVATETVGPVYLADAAAQALLVAGWMTARPPAAQDP